MSKRLRGFQLARIFAGSRSGNIAIIAGLSMTILVGFCGLGTDTAYWFYSSRSLQGAADIASFNAAVALNGGASGTALKTAATTAATSNWLEWHWHDHRQQSADVRYSRDHRCS